MESNQNKDVSEKKQVGHRKKKARLLKERENEELKWMLDHPGGRWFLWRILEYCGVYRTLSANDPHKMAIKSGQRDVGLWILKEVEEANPKGYLLLANEATDRNRNV